MQRQNAFDIYAITRQTIHYGAHDIWTLLAYRRISNLHREIVDEDSDEIWAKLLTYDDLANAFRKDRLYFVERGYFALGWYQASRQYTIINDSGLEEVITVPNASLFEKPPPVAEYHFIDGFSYNLFPDIDAFFIKEGYLNALNRSGQTALMGTFDASVIGGREQEVDARVERLLKAGANPFVRGGLWNETALFGAARGYPNSVRTLLTTRLRVNDTNDSGSTPLFTAAYRHRLDIMQILIDAGANVNHKDNSGSTVFNIACGLGNKDYNMMEFLLRNGYDVANSIDNNGFPLLHQVATIIYQMDPKVLALLIKYGADLNVQDPNGRTALCELASQFAAGLSDGKRGTCFEVLMGAGADVNIADNRGSTPLRYMVAIDRRLYVRLLIEKGANVNARDDKHKYVLDYTFKANLDLLLDAGANVNLLDENGNTYAMRKCLVASLFAGIDDATLTDLESLLARGKTDYSVKNTFGKTILDLCKSDHRLQAIVTKYAPK